MNKNKFLSVSQNTLKNHNVSTLQDLWVKAKAEGYTGLCKTCSVELVKDIETRKFHAVFSSEALDRHGEIVEQSFDLKAFKKNPVLLDSHNYNSIEHIIGRIAPIGVRQEMLQGDIEFALDNPKGLLAFNLADKGFLNTTSIGFIPKEFDDKGNVTHSELLEISAVSVPANPEALFEKQNEEEPEEPVQEVPPEVPAEDPVEVPPYDPRRETKDAVNALLEIRQRHLQLIAREIQKITEPTVRKRKVYQSIRELLKAE